MGRLLGTVLSGWVFQRHGLAACLAVSATLVAIAALISVALPRHVSGPAAPLRSNAV
jgi:predicted MFS family arabinose efflux permease